MPHHIVETADFCCPPLKGCAKGKLKRARVVQDCPNTIQIERLFIFCHRNSLVSQSKTDFLPFPSSTFFFFILLKYQLIFPNIFHFLEVSHKFGNDVSAGIVSGTHFLARRIEIYLSTNSCRYFNSNLKATLQLSSPLLVIPTKIPPFSLG